MSWTICPDCYDPRPIRRCPRCLRCRVCDRVRPCRPVKVNEASNLAAMGNEEHSAAFAALRDRIVNDLEDEDRRRLAALLGAMTDPQPELSPAVVAALRAIVALDVGDRGKLSKWCARYLNRWGQIPQAAALLASKAAERRQPPT